MREAEREREREREREIDRKREKGWEKGRSSGKGKTGREEKKRKKTQQQTHTHQLHQERWIEGILPNSSPLKLLLNSVALLIANFFQEFTLFVMLYFESYCSQVFDEM